MATLVRLARLAKHLEAGRPGGHAVFDFNVVALAGDAETPTGHCGSAGCAIGELPVVWPRYWAFEPVAADGYMPPYLLRGDEFTLPRAVAKWFGIPVADVYGLFYPGEERWWNPQRLSGTASAQDVAAGIRQYIAACAAKKAAE